MRRLTLEKWPCVAILLALGLCFGCRGKEEPAGGPATGDKSAQVAESPAGSEPAVGGGPQAHGAFSVKVLPQHPTAKDDLRLVFSGAKEILSCRWERNGEPVEVSDYACLPRNNFVKGDVVKVAVVADGKQADASVTIGNAAPEVVAVPLKDSAIHRGVDIEVRPEGADIDGDPVTFRHIWTINGEELSSLDSPVLPGDRFRKGDRISIRVVPFDGEAEGREYQGREFVVPNAPPLFVSTPALQFKSEIYAYDVRAEDPDGDPLTFSLEAAPPGMEIESRTGRLKWAVGKTQAGAHVVRVVVEDEEGLKAVQEYTLNISFAD